MQVLVHELPHLTPTEIEQTINRGVIEAELILLLVEGTNDVIRLDTLGIPAVALCSNTISREQAEKVVNVSREQGAASSRSSSIVIPKASMA